MNETGDDTYDPDAVSPSWSTDEGKRGLERIRDMHADEALDETEPLDPDSTEKPEEDSN